MNERIRAVLLGVGLGVATLLLVDLARILGDAIEADGGDTSAWWAVACYLAVGLVVATGVASGRRERIVPAIAAVVVALIALPAVPTGAATWIPELPLVPATAAAQAVAFAAVGAFVYGAARG